MRISKHNIHHHCILYALSLFQRTNFNQYFAHAIKSCTKYINRKKAQQRQILCVGVMSFVSSTNKSQSTSRPFFNNYSEPGVLLSVPMPFLCNHKLPLNFSFYLTMEWYISSLFVSSQHPQWGNFLSVWATDTRQALWKQNLWQGAITNWKHPSLSPKWHLGGRLLRWRGGSPLRLIVTAPMTHDCLWHLGLWFP